MSASDNVPTPHDTVTDDAPPRDTPSGARPGDRSRAPQVRSGTVVWGLVLVLLGAAVTAIGLGVTLDLQATLIGLLVLAGTALLVGAFLSARRTRS